MDPEHSWPCCSWEAEFRSLPWLPFESRAFSAGVDPDDTYNETPYEKGFCFVSYLAHLVGDQDQFDDFLKVHQL